MREKFIFLGSTDTTGSDLKALQGGALTERDRLRKKVVELLGQHGTLSERRENTALKTLETDLSAIDAHAALWKYEKAHLAAGEDWPAAKQKLQQFEDPKGIRRIFVTDFLGSFGGGAYGSAKSAKEDLNRGTAQVEGLLNPGEKDEKKWEYIKLGTVFLGDARFTDLRPQPKDLLNTVYVLGRIVSRKRHPELEADPNHTSAHFVWLPNSETYVRRFVTRGLNHNDVVNIMNGADLGAPVQVVKAQPQEVKNTKKPTRHDVAEGAVLSEEEQILSHTRGWAKRYISTGVSGRPVFSTRGTQFMSIYGTAVIDLAKIDLKSVYDIHSPIAVKNVLDWNASEVTSHGPGNNARSFSDEEFLALRDVLRTRELLIKFRVPCAAVNCILDADRLLGLGANNFDGPKDLIEGIRRWQRGWPSDNVSDALNYKGYNGKYWLFLMFADRRDREDFCRTYRPPFGVQFLRMKRYMMPVSMPGWK